MSNNIYKTPNMDSDRLKVMVVLGTRPEIIRLSCVISALENNMECVLVHTGQNYDYELNQVFFNDLGVKEPDHYLEVDTSSLGKMMGEILYKIEDLILLEKPDAFLVLGDTNSAISILMAKRMKIPTYHMEAGNRSYDANVPEEINRKLVDHISDFNLVYTEHARRHLLGEGLHPRFIYLTGSPMKEVLDLYRDKIYTSKIISSLNIEKKKYFIVSIHREENVDNIENLQNILQSLNYLYEKYNMPIVFSTHPRTKKKIKALEDNYNFDGIIFYKPFGFYDYNHLQLNSLCTISDSGTISEESALLDFPAVTLRNSIERPEALDTGAIVMSGIDSNLINAVEFAINCHLKPEHTEIPCDYKISNTSLRVVNLIMGTAKLTNTWKNMSDFNRYD